MAGPEKFNARPPITEGTIHLSFILGLAYHPHLFIRDYAAALATATQKRFLGPLAWKKSAKFLLLKPNPLVDPMVAQVSLKKYFFPEFWAHHTLRTQDTSLLWRLRTPGQHRPVVVGQGKSRSHMNIPPPGMIRDSGSHFNHTLGQPVHGPPHFFTPNHRTAGSCAGSYRPEPPS